MADKRAHRNPRGHAPGRGTRELRVPQSVRDAGVMIQPSAVNGDLARNHLVWSPAAPGRLRRAGRNSGMRAQPTYMPGWPDGRSDSSRWAREISRNWRSTACSFSTGAFSISAGPELGALPAGGRSRSATEVSKTAAAVVSATSGTFNVRRGRRRPAPNAIETGTSGRARSSCVISATERANARQGAQRSRCRKSRRCSSSERDRSGARAARNRARSQAVASGTVMLSQTSSSRRG